MITFPTVGFGTTYTTDEVAEKTVLCALKAGYRVINACLAYRNLKGMGRALVKCGIPRSELCILVLDSNERRSSENIDEFDVYKATIEQICDSLDCLSINYIDYYVINWPVPRYAEKRWHKLNADTWRAMESVQKNFEGRLKHLGVSNFLPLHIDELMKTSTSDITINQLEIHPYFQQRETVAYSVSKGMKIFSWSPLLKGELLKDPIINDVANRYEKTPAQIILRWNIQRRITPIVSSSNEERIKSNFDVFDFVISEEDMSRINALENGRHFDNYSYARQLQSIKE